MKRRSRLPFAEIKQEQWKHVVGYEGFYEISNIGRVKRLPRLSHQIATIVNPILTPYGYFICSLGKNKKHRNYFIHRLVAIAFIENPRNCSDVNHLDGDRKNYKLENLEWCTRGENHKHAFRTGLRHQNGDKNQSRKLNSRHVKEIVSRYTPNVYTREMICQDYHIDISTVRDILNGESWSTVTGIKKGKGRKMVLSNSDIIKIKAYAKNGLTHTKIGEKYGVSQSYITNIILGKRRSKENIYER